MIRPATLADAPAIARVHVDSWRETYKGIVPDDFLANLSYEQRESNWRRGLENSQWQGRMFVADEEGKVVGFVAGGSSQDTMPAGFDCGLWAIYLLKAHQHQGIGKQLFAAFVQQMLVSGNGSMFLWVLAENPSVGFYQHMGGEKVAEAEIEVGGKKLIEHGYGWHGLGELSL